MREWQELSPGAHSRKPSPVLRAFQGERHTGRGGVKGREIPVIYYELQFLLLFKVVRHLDLFLERRVEVVINDL